MRAGLVALTMLASAPCLAAGEAIETTSGAVLCASPFNVKDGHAAAAASDAGWLRELGCVLTDAGVSGTFLGSDEIDHIWRVRIKLPSSGGATVYGLSCSFKKPGGNQFACRQTSVY